MIVKKNYEQPYQITSDFIDRHTNGPTLNTGSPHQLLTFAVDLEMCLTTLTGLDCVNEINNQHILKQIIKIDCQKDYNKYGVQLPITLCMKSNGQFLLLTLTILCVSKHVKLITQFLDCLPNVKSQGKNLSFHRRKLARNMSTRYVYFVLRSVRFINVRVLEVFPTKVDLNLLLNITCALHV